MQDVKGVIVVAVVIATIALLLAFVGAVVIAYWPIVVAILAALVGGIVYLKHRKRTQNLV